MHARVLHWQTSARIACILHMHAACRRTRDKRGHKGRAGRHLGDVLLEQGEERLEKAVVLAEQPGLRNAARVQRRERDARALVEAAVHLAHGQHVAHLAVLVRLRARVCMASPHTGSRSGRSALRACGARSACAACAACAHSARMA